VCVCVCICIYIVGLRRLLVGGQSWGGAARNCAHASGVKWTLELFNVSNAVEMFMNFASVHLSSFIRIPVFASCVHQQSCS